MDLAGFVDLAARRGASDLHIEAGLPLALRIRGQLSTMGAPIPERQAQTLARQLFHEADWAACLQRGSADLTVDLAGHRCRINVLRTSRGMGLALRLLCDHQVTLASLNLHPELGQLMEQSHGLVLVSGTTGCGKTSTLAALIQELNLSRAAHVVTIEQPIEYALTPVRAFIRQREVGRDTPSFAQGLVDTLREDPDVVMVGEMRQRETMRLTLDACETGHLVLTTIHSSTPADALQRIVSAFPAEQQASVCAQLADHLLAVICQRLVWREEIGLRVPECTVLCGSQPARSSIRQGDFFKLATIMQTGARDGQWTLERYRSWLDQRDTWAPLPRTPTRRTRHGTVATRGTESGAVVDGREVGDDQLLLRPGTNLQPSQRESPGNGPERLPSDPDANTESSGEVYRIDGEPGSLADILEQLEDDPPA